MESIKNIKEEITRLSEAIARLTQGDTQNPELQQELKLLAQDLLERVHLLRFAHKIFDEDELELEETSEETPAEEPIENIEQQILDKDQQEDIVAVADEDLFEPEDEDLDHDQPEAEKENKEEDEEEVDEEAENDAEKNHIVEQEENEIIEEPTGQEEEILEDSKENTTEPSQKEKDSESLNEKISKLSKANSLASKHQNQPIQNLKTAIGLNERFLFANELFHGDGAEYLQAIEEFNHLASMDDAVRLIEHKYQPKYNWDFDTITVQNFIHYLQRRYSNRESA